MKSIWSDTLKNVKEHDMLIGDIKTDVLIIGGGIAGVLCAYRLASQNVSCILVEGGRMLSGNTHNTTAKITAQHGLIYDKLIGQFGEEKARMYYDVNSAAIEEYKKLSKEIPCDFEEKTAYVYSSAKRGNLEKEADAYSLLGIPFEWKDSIPLPVECNGAVGIADQAQFNPLMLLCGLLPYITYYENTFVEKIEEGRAITRSGSITAKHIILATHYPLINISGLYFMKLTQNRSHVLALEEGPQIDGMYIDEDKKGYSFRNYKNMLLVGDVGQKTGKQCGGWQKLKQVASINYPEKEIKYAWAAQDCMTLDGMPYIGRHSRGKDNIYVATGFNKWGMTSAMAASSVIADLIMYGSSEYSELFSPQRSMLHSELFANLSSAVVGLLTPGKKCTHMGCGLKWNDKENSWDCPCHGSRFGSDGHVIDNPAKRGISVEK